MPARLNNAADCLATNYSIQHGILCLDVPRMAINCVQLCTKNGVISSHYYKKTRDIATTKDLRDHIKEKRGWSDEISTVSTGPLINAVKTDCTSMTPKS
eukprot:14183111-Ditylum_brightwellii.AAC.1